MEWFSLHNPGMCEWNNFCCTSWSEKHPGQHKVMPWFSDTENVVGEFLYFPQFLWHYFFTLHACTSLCFLHLKAFTPGPYFSDYIIVLALQISLWHRTSVSNNSLYKIMTTLDQEKEKWKKESDLLFKAQATVLGSGVGTISKALGCGLWSLPCRNFSWPTTLFYTFWLWQLDLAQLSIKVSKTYEQRSFKESAPALSWLQFPPSKESVVTICLGVTNCIVILQYIENSRVCKI